MVAVSDSDVLDRPKVGDPSTEDDDAVAHIVHSNGLAKAKVTEAVVMGTPLEALCGVIFVPSKDASRLPVCGECKAIKDALQGR